MNFFVLKNKFANKFIRSASF